MGKLRVRLVRGLAGKPEKHIKAVKSLGLRKWEMKEFLKTTLWSGAT
jgi:ribosomal protein L30/L7E